MPHILLVFIIVGSCFSIIGLRIYLPHLWAKERNDLQNGIFNPTHPPKFYKNFKTLSGTVDEELPMFIVHKNHLNNLEKKANHMHPSLSPSIFASANNIGDNDKKRTDNVLLPLFSMLIMAISVIFAFILLFRQRTECSKPQSFDNASTADHASSCVKNHPTDRSGLNWQLLAANLVTFFREYQDDPGDIISSQGDDGSASSENDPTWRDTDLPQVRPGESQTNDGVDNTIRDLKALEQLLLSYRRQNFGVSNANYDEASFEKLIRRLNLSLKQILVPADPGVASKYQTTNRSSNWLNFAFQPKPKSFYSDHPTTVGGSCRDLRDPESTSSVIKRRKRRNVLI